MSSPVITATTAPPVRVAGDGEDVIAADHLTKRFGSVTAVDDLSFALTHGTVTGFLGPNGAGKTTTLRMLLGLTRPTQGTALLFGRHYIDIPNPATRVGAVLEATDFHPGRSGHDHLLMLACAAGLPVQRVDEVLAKVSLTKAARRRVWRLLDGHETAARTRRFTPWRSRVVDPRRTGERTRPRGRALAS